MEYIQYNNDDKTGNKWNTCITIMKIYHGKKEYIKYNHKDQPGNKRNTCITITMKINLGTNGIHAVKQ